MKITLRKTHINDLPLLFEFQRDEEANYMAAFGAKDPADRDAFMQKWNRIVNDKSVTMKTILYDNQVAGSVLSHSAFGVPEVSYWIDKKFWGKGIATNALGEFLKTFTTRPVFARVVWDNKGSIRVLEKCGFEYNETETGFANARGKEVEEFIYKLEN